MNTLVGEILDNDIVVKSAMYTYNSREEFFLALVDICHELDVEVPIWSKREDKGLETHGEVLIPLFGKRSLKIKLLSGK